MVSLCFYRREYIPTPGISINSPRIFLPASIIFLIDSSISYNAMTTDGYCTDQTCFLRKKPPLIATAFYKQAFAGFSGGCKDIIAHILVEHLHLQIECKLIKFCYWRPIITNEALSNTHKINIMTHCDMSR